jgi:RNA polymerase sigma-70 factor (ECF subfamily)
LKERSQNTDLELFARISNGDEQAYREIFHVYNKQLFPFVTSLVKSDSDAREIMQEVFLKLWLQREALSKIDNPGGWLRTVTSNTAYDFLRKQARYEIRLTRIQAIQPQSDDEFWQKFDAKQARILVYEALRKLPFRRRQIFQLNKIEGFSRKEIAEQLNISENTVRNQLVDAVAFVQDYLRKNIVSLIIVFFIFS